MVEISPVLSGKFSAPDYPSAVSNFNRVNAPASETTPTATVTRVADASVTESSGTEYISPTSSNYVDPRRYTKFDRSAAQVQDAPDFSFGDFLDMINPLQHIPGVSSIYREITGETIHPTARIAGDIIYGGVLLGGVSAIVGGVTAVGDAVAEAETGHDTTGVVLAALFGDDKKEATTQIASNETAADPAKATATAIASTAATQPAPANTQPIPQTADQWLTLANKINSSPENAVTKATLNDAGADASAQETKVAAATAPLMQAKAFPLNRQAYGGVMAPTSTTDNIENQNRIIALSEGSHALRLGHTIYTNKLMNGPKPMPAPAAVAAAPKAADGENAPSVSASANAAAISPAARPSSPAASATADIRHNPLPQQLINDLMMMKAVNQYQGTASAAGRSTPLGASVDMSN